MWTMRVIPVHTDHKHSDEDVSVASHESQHMPLQCNGIIEHAVSALMLTPTSEAVG